MSSVAAETQRKLVLKCIIFSRVNLRKMSLDEFRSISLMAETQGK